MNAFDLTGLFGGGVIFQILHLPKHLSYFGKPCLLSRYLPWETVNKELHEHMDASVV